MTNARLEFMLSEFILSLLDVQYNIDNCEIVECFALTNVLCNSRTRLLLASCYVYVQIEGLIDARFASSHNNPPSTAGPILHCIGFCER
jgi:hypothetical protein